MQRKVLCEFDVDPNARFHGETGDLQELLGNLLENAFKWARSRVLLTVRVGETAPGRRSGLFIAVEDDGRPRVSLHALDAPADRRGLYQSNLRSTLADLTGLTPGSDNDPDSSVHTGTEV